MVNDNFYLWNHCALDVEAVPSWELFMFGGCTPATSFDEIRERGKCVKRVYWCDLESQ